ncbi:diguanylate cyclase [Thalassotalea sp. LPB0316]|uniref:ligand-binding sensor domain-containing protein n=1 Tax=Thalassotalea sp. LPB0316 TaxID=2769490 RepID=UPI001867CB50|nr:two-component regulator propeller domain-containing protein [Thalassotalea sp. LPB0316]QOL25956.1 diguanylate cyclase [Thalassotalea sp. LPB0316]
MYRLSYLVTLFLVLLSVLAKTSAQEVKHFKNFGVDNPMSYSFVRAIAQDQYGFIWFGSSEGLDRFDGHQTVSFYHDKNDPHSLSSNVISRLLIDQQDRMWVGTFGGGLNLYRPSSNDFIHFSAKQKQQALSNDTVNALFEDTNGNIWVGTANGLNVITYVDEQWQVKQIRQQLGNPNSLTHNTIHAITQTFENEIWVGTNGGGISVFDLNGNFVKAVKYGDSNKSQYLNKFVSALYADNQGQVWIGTEDKGLLRYSVSTDKFDHYQYSENEQSQLTSNTINHIYQDTNSNIWIATDNGLSIYQHREQRFSHHRHSPQNPYSLSNDYILTFFEDNNKMMWVGTFTGVNRWDPNIATFSQFSSHTNPVMSNNNITSFAQLDQNTLLFSTYAGGIYQMSIYDQRIEKLDFNGYFDALRVMSLFVDGNTLWVGSRASGLHAVDLPSGKITSYQHDAKDPQSLSANSVTDIIKDANGSIWVSTFHFGLNRLNNDGRFTRYTKNETTPELGPSSNHILQLLEDDQGFIWAATFGGGLSRFSPTTQQFLHLRHDDAKPNSLSDDFTWIMLLDDEGKLWVGTQTTGLNILTKQRRLNNDFSFDQLDSSDGMKSMTIYGILQDLNRDIWFTTSKGISRYSQQHKSFKHFGLNHGLVDLEFTHGSAFKSANNILFFGSGKGFNSIEPENVDSFVTPPEVRLTNILKLNEAMTLEVPIAELESLVLDYTDQLVSFEYVGLNYASPESTRYRYRLKGFDEAWIDAGKSRRATYTNLPAGNYQLEIIASVNESAWSTPGLSLAIQVLPAPWHTWWAYLLYAVIVAIVLLSYSRFLNRKLLIEQEQKAYLKQQVQEKTQEFMSKNVELEQANQLLEEAATTDKVTGVKSRRYLDIYIEQATQLMSQIHENLLPVQRHLLPRLYLLMVKVSGESVSNSQLVNLSDFLLYSRNNDDLVIRWSEDAFVIIGFEKENNARELAERLTTRCEQAIGKNLKADVAFSFYPFNFEQPMALSWDHVSAMTEHALVLSQKENGAWLGLYSPKVQPFNYLDVIQQPSIAELANVVNLKQG